MSNVILGSFAVGCLESEPARALLWQAGLCDESFDSPFFLFGFLLSSAFFNEFSASSRSLPRRADFFRLFAPPRKKDAAEKRVIRGKRRVNRCAASCVMDSL